MYSHHATFFAGNLSRHVGVSDYANTLAPHVKKKSYLEKMSCVGIDPVLIPDKTYDPECLSPVESMSFLLTS